MRKHHVVRLTVADRAALTTLVGAGSGPARARILLKADAGPAGPAWTDARIAGALEVSVRTVARVRARWAAQGVEAAVHRRRPRRVYRRRLDGAAEAHLVALACAERPAGQARWSVRLLARKLVETEVVETIGRETVRVTLKKTCSSRG